MLLRRHRKAEEANLDLEVKVEITDESIEKTSNEEALDETMEENKNESCEEVFKEESTNEETLNETEEEDKIDYSKLKVDELKNLLDEKEIEYDSKAKKEDLIKLLEGAE